MIRFRCPMRPAILPAAATAAALALAVSLATGPVALAAPLGGGAYRVLHEFDGSDGDEPGFIIQASNGMLYGTAFIGGVGGSGVGEGTVYRETLAGGFEVLHRFTDTPDGSTPTRLFQASDGFIYVIAASGGQFGQGVIYRMDLHGGLTPVHAFTGGADGANPNYLTEVSPGLFYGTTSLGGSAPANCHLPPQGVAFRMTRTGAVTPLHTFCENIDGSGPDSIVSIPGGDFLGTAFEDGPLGLGTGAGTLWRMNPRGDVTLLHVFHGTTVESPDAAQPGSLVRGPDGRYYGIGNDGGAFSNGAIFRTDPSGHVEVVHSFNDFGSDGIDPGGLVSGGDGFLYGNARRGGLPVGGNDDQGVVYRFDTAGNLWVLHSFDFAHGGHPGTPFAAGGGLLVGNTGQGGTAFVPHGVTYALAPATPVASFTLLRSALHPGEGTWGRITLAEPAPPGGERVQLFATGGVSVPSSVLVPAGSLSVAVPVQTSPSGGGYRATLTASIGPVGESVPLDVTA